ncbi:hypothetical protein [Nocardioides sp. B-3]|uniref:hypothetical protein n=1 Tax=Nocardioides sp. B-3 TaxID=2895565 RepID=UPI0021520927|nr:hypothetical protein [Nocardioides sp. B-3]UUZ58032.1 hypothetical protein LP418_17135 [Nocardioides sp. B-3]
MWQFSNDIGDAGEDWREAAPLRRLDAPIGDEKTRVDLIRQQISGAPAYAGGSTGLYESVPAAYRLATREYNPAYVNSVAVFSGGVNNTGSLTLTELVSELESLHDPDRPVLLVMIGIGGGADRAALTQMAAATDGRVFEANTPDGLLTVLAQSLLSR